MIARLFLATITTLAATIATAEDGAALVASNNCGMCHDHGVGQTLQAISAKYAGKPDAKTTLAAVIKNGTEGMPPSDVSEADAGAMASYILALKK